MKDKLTIIVIIILIALGLRILSGEDGWACQNGQWVKHGNPSTPIPINDCK